MPLDSLRPNPRPSLRLHKYLASCGVGSRRACEKLIEQGVVQVDGVVVSEQGVSIDPGTQTVRVAGRVVAPETKVYFLLNKPRDVLCTSRDPQGRRTFRDLLPELPERVYTVGRLDRDSEGLLLVTNDGDFAHALTHPRHQVTKKYRVWIERPLIPAEEKRLLDGVSSEGELLSVLEIRRVRSRDARACYEVFLAEGRNRHLRRLFAELGREVLRLQRTEIGSLKLGRLGRGMSRTLRATEVRELMALAG